MNEESEKKSFGAWMFDSTVLLAVVWVAASLFLTPAGTDDTNAIRVPPDDGQIWKCWWFGRPDAGRSLICCRDRGDAGWVCREE